jgi:hypothetical protein
MELARFSTLTNTHRRVIRRAVIALCALPAGCYGYYSPVAGGPLANRPVQLTLTDSGAVVLAPRVGPSVEVLSGTLLESTNESYLLAVATVLNRYGEETTWKGERVEIARRLVIRVEERRFSRSRTALFTGLLSAALISVEQAFLGRGNGAPGPSPGGPPVAK